MEWLVAYLAIGWAIITWGMIRCGKPPEERRQRFREWRLTKPIATKLLVVLGAMAIWPLIPFMLTGKD